MAPPKAAAARNNLDQVKKVEVIHMYEKGSKSQQAIATEFGVGKTQISNILKRRREYLDEYEANGPSTKKRNCRKTGNEEINKLCWAWFTDKVSRGSAVSGPLLQVMLGKKLIQAPSLAALRRLGFLSSLRLPKKLLRRPQSLS